MWSFVLIVLGVIAWIALAIGLILAIAIGIIFTMSIVECAKAEEEVARMNCNHENYHYSESHPNKVWRCNDCGADF
jgi:uncharacterized membrane-anchored protein YhcB (DUF1043 family)